MKWNPCRHLTPDLPRRFQTWMILFGLALFSGTARAAECTVFDRTTLTLPKLTADDLRAVSSGPAGFVAVGANGAVVHSLNGTSWDRAASSTFNTLLSVAGAEAGYVAVGERGITMFSADGIQWEGSTAGRSNLHGVAYGNATWVVAGDGGKVFASADGKAWAPQPTTTTNNFVGLAFGSGLFVAASELNEVHVSSDGTNWVRYRVPAPITHIRTVQGGFFGLTANQKIASSIDGKVWSVITDNTLTDVNDIGTDGNQLYAVGPKASLYQSTQTLGWTQVPVPATVGGRDIFGVAFNNGLGVAVGAQGLILSFNAGGAVTSRNNDKFDDLLGVAFGNDTFVAVGKSGRVSANAGDLLTDWKFPDIGFTNNLTGIAFGNGVFVAVGGYSTNETALQTVGIFTSANGTNWVRTFNAPAVTNATTAEIGYVTDVAYGGGKFVAVSPAGVALVSANGTDWTAYSSPGLSTLSRVSYAGDRFLATGLAIAYSLDGEKWFRMIVNAPEQPLNAAASDGKQYLAVGSVPSLVVTTNLLEWAPVALNGFTNGLYDVIYQGHQFVGVGRGNSRASMTYSYNGSTWVTKTFASVDFLRGVTFGKGLFVMVGDRGRIYITSETDPDNGLPGPSTWVRTSGGTDRDAATGAALDPNCGYYVGGYFRGTLTLGDTTLTATGDPSFYLARYNDIGVPRWAITGEGTSTVSKVVSLPGITFVGGSAPYGLTLAAGEVLPSEGVGGFVAAVDASGVPQWIRSIPGSVSDVIATKTSTVKYAGLFAQRMVFGEELLMESTNTPLSFFLVKADLIGTNVWGRFIEPKTGAFLDGLKLASDDKGATFAAGTASGALNFWEAKFVPPVEGEADAFTGWTNILNAKLTLSNAPSVFLTKYDPTGKFLWVTNTGLSGAILTAASPATDGGVILSGNAGSVMFIAKYSLNGALLWRKDLDAAAGAQLTAFTTTTNGYAIGAGYFQNELTLGTETLSTGGTASFVFHMDPDGNFLNVRSYGTAPALVGYSTPSAIAADSTSEYLLAGYYDERVSFGPGALVTRGLSDGFLARLRTPPTTPGALNAVRQADGSLVFEFPFGYVLQRSDSIEGGDWTTVLGASPVTVPKDQAGGFFRLIWP